MLLERYTVLEATSNELSQFVRTAKQLAEKGINQTSSDDHNLAASSFFNQLLND